MAARRARQARDTVIGRPAPHARWSPAAIVLLSASRDEAVVGRSRSEEEVEGEEGEVLEGGEGADDDEYEKAD